MSRNTVTFSNGPDAPSFTARPYVCGAIGRWDPGVLDRLVAAAPTGVRQMEATGRAALWASTGLERWRSRDTHGHLWWPAASGTAPDSWRAAAENRLAAGLVLAPRGAVLHSCALGFQELYYRRIGEALYFSLRIDPLLVLGHGKAHPDFDAWAGILMLSAPVGEATPFQEIRRLGAASGWQADDDGLSRVTLTPAWLTDDPVTAPDPTRTAELIQRALPPRRRLTPMIVPLSGGWDSRLLATLARRAGSRVSAWTTDPDDGTDRDLSYAGPVADQLRLRHRVVTPDPHGWLDDRASTLERVQYQTPMHNWAAALARRLPGRAGPLLDGLAGDVLLKGSSYATEEVTAVGPGPKQLDRFWHRVAAKIADRPELLAPDLAGQLAEQARTDFDRVASGFGDHPAGVNLIQLYTRTARAIANCPIWIFGPESDVRIPFVHPAVIQATLRAPGDGAAFYREVLLAAGGPELASLPSTNDPAIAAPERAARRCQSPASLVGLIASIKGSPEAHALLGPKLQRALAGPEELDRVLRWRVPRLTLLWADMLALWLRRYAGRVTWSSPI